MSTLAKPWRGLCPPLQSHEGDYVHPCNNHEGDYVHPCKTMKEIMSTLAKPWRGLCPPLQSEEGGHVHPCKTMKGIMSTLACKNHGGDSVHPCKTMKEILCTLAWKSWRGLCPPLQNNEGDYVHPCMQNHEGDSVHPCNNHRFCPYTVFDFNQIKGQRGQFVKKHLRKCNFSKKGYCKNRLQIQIVTFISL